jgi:hypothetical protein
MADAVKRPQTFAEGVAIGSRIDNPLITPARREYWLNRVKKFWQEFKSSNSRPKFVFGCNVYSQSILQICSLDGFVDDFSKEPTFCGLPIIKTSEIPRNALVLVASGGRPLTARRKLNCLGIEQLDYFSLYRWSGVALRDIVFNEGFCDEYVTNEREYHWIYNRLNDDFSQHIFKRLVNFRFNYDLDFMADILRISSASTLLARFLSMWAPSTDQQL